jgi:hypothetical protein
VSLLAKKVLGVGTAVIVVGVLIGLYVATWATSFPRTVAAASSSTSAGVTTNLTLQTVAAVGPKYSPANPDWVSYLVQSKGKWIHTTEFKVPANSLVHVTVLQYDGDSGLRNPFLSQVQGTVGATMTVDGKTLGSIDPEEASHTFAVPELGILVPLPGVEDEAKNQCEFAPCTMAEAHRTISFTIRTHKKGRYHWQCFVPCAAGFLTGGGGPMQTLGYMDGYLEVV